MKHNLKFVLFATFLLTGCSATLQEQRACRLELPELPKLNRVQFDFPRDMSKTVEYECGKKEICKIHPVIDNTNVFLGLDEENFSRLLENLKILENYITHIRKLTEEVCN